MVLYIFLINYTEAIQIMPLGGSNQIVVQLKVQIKVVPKFKLNFRPKKRFIYVYPWKVYGSACPSIFACRCFINSPSPLSFVSSIRL